MKLKNEVPHLGETANYLLHIQPLHQKEGISVKNSQSLDIGRALSFMFEDQEWIMKVITAIVIFCLSIFILPYFLLQGYVIEIIRRVGRNEQPELPAWEDWGKYFSEGFMAFIALFIYSLPMMILVCCFMMVIIAAGEEGGDEVAGFFVLLFCCVMIFAFLFQLGVYLIYYAGLVRYADSGDFNVFFQFGKLWGFVRQNLNNYGLALLITFGTTMVASAVPILGSVWALLVTGHLFGQVLRQTRDDDFGFDSGMETPISQY